MKTSLAIAIEDRVDLWFRGDPNSPYIQAFAPLDISEAQDSDDYMAAVYLLIRQLLHLLVNAQEKMTAKELFNSIASVVVSVPGVVDKNSRLLQVPVWHSKQYPTVRWVHKKTPEEPGVEKEFFDFPVELADLADILIKEQNTQWSIEEKERFSSIIYVVNDASACAAFEYSKHKDQSSDFVYVKLHNGVNVGTVQPGYNGYATVRVNHPEAGHSFPIPFRLDHEAKYEGCCYYHKWCFEGMLAVHGFYKRAMESKSSPIFSSWGSAIEALSAAQETLKGQRLDNALLRFILSQKPENSEKYNEGVLLIAHYAAQLVYQLAIGPLSPGQIVIGGRMARPEVLSAIRENVKAWCNNYPMRDSLNKDIERYIVPSLASRNERHTIEVHGAMAIASGRASDFDPNTPPYQSPISKDNFEILED
jgi:hypothetical protein